MQLKFETLIDFSHYEKRNLIQYFELFKILLRKNEKVDILNIDAKLIDLQKKMF